MSNITDAYLCRLVTDVGRRARAAAALARFSLAAAGDHIGRAAGVERLGARIPRRAAPPGAGLGQHGGGGVRGARAALLHVRAADPGPLHHAERRVRARDSRPCRRAVGRQMHGQAETPTRRRVGIHIHVFT